ncbi:leucine-rich repeat-containing protein 71 isoform X5 [Athene noctua]|uniref:leucine-rich repeat-containing protein 71 isoform X5 n=1 Tax=Athene noctua TaxID=126797 RepID=UPI003EB9F580
MRRRGERVPREKVAEEEVKSGGRKAEQGAEQYQCSGLLEQDFPELCARAGITGVPRVTLRPPPSFPAEEEPPEPPLAEVLARIERKYSPLQPRIQVEREHEDPRSVRAVFLRGWKLEEAVLGVLSQCLPALAGLQAVHLWKVGLTERLLPALAALPGRCPRLRTLSLEGNPLPEPAFHTLLGSDSTLAHLSLRNNSIGDAAARLIGQSLACNRSLVSLSLSFNRISDLGAGGIAQGLRLNRSLLSLSLANNDIGDAGATRLAEPPQQRGRPRHAAPGQARQKEKGAAAEGGGQTGQEIAGAKTRPQQNCETQRPGEAEPGGGGCRGDGVERGGPIWGSYTPSGAPPCPAAAGGGQAAPGQHHPAGQPGAPQPQPELQSRHGAGSGRAPGSAGEAAAGGSEAGDAGAAVPLAGGKPHPPHQPGFCTAPGAAAAARLTPGRGGGGGWGGLTGPPACGQRRARFLPF